MTKADQVIERVIELTQTDDLQWNRIDDGEYQCKRKGSLFNLIRDAHGNCELQVSSELNFDGENRVSHSKLIGLWGMVGEQERRLAANSPPWAKALDDLSD